MSDEAFLAGPSTRMFQIREDDLAELERIVPDLQQACFPRLAKSEGGSTKLRKQLEKAKDIISNVRWRYGPPLDVKIIPMDEAGNVE